MPVRVQIRRVDGKLIDFVMPGGSKFKNGDIIWLNPETNKYELVERGGRHENLTDAGPRDDQDFIH